MKDGGVHYTRNGSVRLAYRVFGDGDTTLVWIPGWISNVDLWTDPSLPFTPFVEGSPVTCMAVTVVPHTRHFLTTRFGVTEREQNACPEG